MLMRRPRHENYGGVMTIDEKTIISIEEERFTPKTTLAALLEAAEKHARARYHRPPIPFRYQFRDAAAMRDRVAPYLFTRPPRHAFSRKEHGKISARATIHHHRGFSFRR